MSLSTRAIGPFPRRDADSQSWSRLQQANAGFLITHCASEPGKTGHEDA